VRALLVVPSARGERNPGAIERRLMELATQGVSARLVAFHEEVGLKVVPNLQMFEELTTLQSAARTMVDWTRNHRFANLRDVWIDGYPDDSLQRFDSGALKVVELFHGRLSNVDLSCIQLRLGAMRQNVEFGNATVTTIDLESCSRIDVASLSRVKGLKTLIFRASRVTSLAFLPNLRALETLALYAVPGASKLDMGPLFLCPSLRNLEINVGERTLRELAERLPSTVRVGTGALRFPGLRSHPP